MGSVYSGTSLEAYWQSALGLKKMAVTTVCLMFIY